MNNTMQYIVLRYILHSAPIYGYLGFWEVVMLSKSMFLQFDIAAPAKSRLGEIATAR
jgi:hypothetical protein